MIMKWGTDRLEATKIPGFIVSTDEGYGLYLKHGYKEIESWEADMSRWPELGVNGKYKNAYLVRHPSHGRTTSGVR